MSGDWFFQECIEAAEEALLLDAVRSGQVGVEDRDRVDRTILMVALECGTAELVRSLLSLGADPNKTSNDGESCLSRAINRGSLELVELLLGAGADIELASTNFLTPLALAALRGDLEIMELLLQNGANIEARGEMDETPLMEACDTGGAEAVHLLLRHGADRNAKNAFGESVVDVARARGNPRILETLGSSTGVDPEPRCDGRPKDRG